MLSVTEADRLIEQRIPPPQVEWVRLDACHGRILADTVRADRDQPPFPRITMDGIAIASADWEHGARNFSLGGIQRAGAPPLTRLGDNTAIEVMTGGFLPHGTDTVVPYEYLEMTASQARISDNENPKIRHGWNVHQTGSDYHSADTLLQPGCRIGSAEIQVLSSIGQIQVQVYRRPRIAVITTGDELVDVCVRPEAWQIRGSNSHSLAAELLLWGYDRPTERHCVDTEASLTETLSSCLETGEVIVLTGGVSKGKFDFVPNILERLGVRTVFHGVRQKPGKPMWFGAAKSGQIVFALPGNPVAALVCFRRFVLPALTAMECHKLPVIKVPIASNYDKEKGLTWFLPAHLISDDAGLRVLPEAMKGSGNFYQLVKTSGIIELPEECNVAEAGVLVSFFHWGGSI